MGGSKDDTLEQGDSSTRIIRTPSPVMPLMSLSLLVLGDGCGRAGVGILSERPAMVAGSIAFRLVASRLGDVCFSIP